MFVLDFVCQLLSKCYHDIYFSKPRENVIVFRVLSLHL